MAGGTKRLPRAVREQQMLDAAVQMFSVNGYHETSMDAIAAEAEISKPMLYLYYGSKEELFGAVLNRELGRFVEAVLYRYRAAIPWRDLPERFGDWKNIHRRFTRWAEIVASTGWSFMPTATITTRTARSSAIISSWTSGSRVWSRVKDIGLPDLLKNAIPLVEFSFTTPGNRGGGPTTGTINPGFLYEFKTCQIGIEAIIPAPARIWAGTTAGAQAAPNTAPV